MNIPSQCLECLNYKTSELRCSIYDYLVGEGDRADVKDCPSVLKRGEEDSLKLLAKYIDDDADGVVEQSINQAVDRILKGYSNKFKVMVIGVARRKIKSVIKMTDIVDRLLDRVSSDELNLTASQSIRLLSELNNSINTDLAFIMKLVQPDSTFQDIQMFFDQRTVNIQANGSSAGVNKVSDDIMRLTSTSRENIRGAFNILLNTLQSERAGTEPVEVSQDFIEEQLDPIAAEDDSNVE